MEDPSAKILTSKLIFMFFRKKIRLEEDSLGSKDMSDSYNNYLTKPGN